MDQFNDGQPWTVTDPKSQIEGGHYVYQVQQTDSTDEKCITWGQPQSMDYGFMKQYGSCFLFPVSQEMLNSKKLSPEGLDWEQITADFNILDGNSKKEEFTIGDTTDTGTFSVNVTGAGGNAIAGATVAYMVDDLNLTATTDSSGNIEVTGLPAGSYTLTISDSGYVSNTTTVAVADGTTTTVNVTLSVTLASIIESLLTSLESEKTAIAESLVSGIITKLEAEEKTSSSIFVKDIRDPIEVALLEQIESGTIPTLANLLVSVLTNLINTKLGATQKK
jgi:hypothetical protein